MKKKTIGIKGSSQIQHIIPALKNDYNVIDLSDTLDNKDCKIKRWLKFALIILKIDILYNVYTSKEFWKIALLAKVLRKKVVTHWIGSDVREAVEGKVDLHKLKYIDKHLSCFEPLQRQLQEIDIYSHVVPIIPFNMSFDVCEMPTQHAVLIYMPEGLERYYGYDDICGVFKEFPDLKFYIVANSNKDMFKNYRNVILKGRLSPEKMEEIYNKVSIILRIHLNDGLSMSIIEGLAKGKKVIWNCALEHVYPGENKQQISQSLREILRTTPQTDMAAHDFIIKEYNMMSFLEKFNKAIV